MRRLNHLEKIQKVLNRGYEKIYALTPLLFSGFKASDALQIVLRNASTFFPLFAYGYGMEYLEDKHPTLAKVAYVASAGVLLYVVYGFVSGNIKMSSPPPADMSISAILGLITGESVYKGLRK